MQPMAIPSVGGLCVSLFVTIFIAPTLFCAVEESKWKRARAAATLEIPTQSSHRVSENAGE